MFRIYFVLNLSFPIVAKVKIYQIMHWILVKSSETNSAMQQ